MKRIYELNICHYNRVEKIVAFNNKKALWKWLVDYFTAGEERVFGYTQYSSYINRQKENNKKPLPFDKFILSWVKHKTIIITKQRKLIILHK